MLPRLTLPPPTGLLALAAALYLLPGLGHDLWKSHDAIGMGIVHSMATSGELMVPRIAGLAWVHDPPLYHWVALAFGSALRPLMEFHAAARIASALFMLAAFWLVHSAARRWTRDEADDGRAIGCAAMLLLLGSVGLMVRAHEALPELASLAALAGAFAALPWALRRPVPAGLAYGAALGLAALSSTWVAPAAVALATLAAAFVSPEWRTRRMAAFFAPALAALLALGLSWPVALALESPHAFLEWWTLAFQLEDRPAAKLRYLLSTGSWFAWPAWPLALWAGWSLRRRWREPRIFVPGLATLAMLAGLSLWGEARDVNLIPALAPLALLAAQALPTLRRGAAAALDWFAVLAFAFFAALLWLGWFAMMTGVPAKLAHNFAKTAPGFAPDFELAPFLAAVALTLGWLYVALFTAPSPLRSVVRWASGMVLLWGVFAMLLMPWAEHQKSYRSVALQLRTKIPAGAGCIASRSLGIAQMAALEYRGGIRTVAFDPLRPRACRLLIVQGNPRSELDGPGPEWSKLADVGRPGDRQERYRLYSLDK